MPLTSQELQSKLWQAADILRGQIDSADYKSYIFSMLFLKRLSDRFDEEVANAVTAGVSRAAAVSDPDEHQFAVPETAHWSQIVKVAMNLGEALNVASHEIEDANAGRIDGVLTGTNWNDESKLGSPANRERIIRSLLNHFNDLDLRDTNFASDREGTGNVLGDAYEYLIYQFADDAGKKAASSTPHGRSCGLSWSYCSPRKECASATPPSGRPGCSSSPPTTCRNRVEIVVTWFLRARNVTWEPSPSASSICCSTGWRRRDWCPAMLSSSPA